LRVSPSALTSNREDRLFILSGSRTIMTSCKLSLTRNGNQIANPNQFFIVGFTEADLAGSKFVPQQFGNFRW
jgi:hypothetical protein